MHCTNMNKLIQWRLQKAFTHPCRSSNDCKIQHSLRNAFNYFCFNCNLLRLCLQKGKELVIICMFICENLTVTFMGGIGNM